MSAKPAPARLNDMQTRIRELLAGAEKPLSAYDVIDALQKLIDEGLAHRLETRNAYVACRSGDAACDEGHDRGHGHAHRAGFMICRSCGRALEFGDAEVEALLAQISSRSGFSAERLAIEIQGLCADCANIA